MFNLYLPILTQNNRSLMKDDRMESNKKKNVVDVAELEEDFM